MKKFHILIITELFILFMSSCGSGSSQSGNSNTTQAESGESIYKRTCITCHQATGEGIPGTYPPLAKSDFLASKEKTIEQVIKGHMGEMVVNGKTYNSVMPAQPLNDDEVAAVLTYVNGNFGNGGTIISAADVKGVRARL